MRKSDAFEEHGDATRVDLTPLLWDSPPEELRRRVRSALRGRGDFRSAGRLTPWRAAAAILLFAAGLGVGVAWSRLAGGSAADPDAGAPSPAVTPPEAYAASTWALVLLGGPRYEEPADRAEAERRVAALARWAAELADSGRLVFAEELGPPAVLLPMGPTTSADPSALGLFVIRAADATEATKIAARSPHVLQGGRIAVQPIIPH